MKPQFPFQAIVRLCGIAALCIPSQALAINFLGAEFSQNIYGVVRDWEGHSGYNSFEAHETVESDFFPVWPKDVNLLWADVERTSNNGFTGSVFSSTIATYQIDPFTLINGFASIGQLVDAEGGYSDDPYHQYYVEAFGGAGNDHIRLRFRVEESDGNVVLRVRSSWINSIPDPYQAAGYPGYISVEQNGVARGWGSGAQSDITNFALTPGDWTLRIEKWGVGIANPNYGSLTVSGQMAASWTFGSTFPGESPSGPFFIDLEPPAATEPPPATDPDNNAGGTVTFPAQGSIGVTGDVFVGLPTKVISGDSVGALITGYEITSEYAPLTSFIVPELPPVIGGLSIDFGAGPQSVIAGQRIDFGPTGVESLTLDGFDPAFASAEQDAFVMGLRFAADGLASLRAVPTLYIPPGDFNQNGLVDAADYVAWRKGLATGIYTEADYETWRSNFGAPAAGTGLSVDSARQSSIPEPMALTLMLLALLPTSTVTRFRL